METLQHFVLSIFVIVGNKSVYIREQTNLSNVEQISLPNEKSASLVTGATSKISTRFTNTRGTLLLRISREAMISLLYLAGE